VVLRVLEWEGYITSFQTEFETYARSKGKNITLSFLKKPDGTPFFIGSYDDVFNALRRHKVDVVTPTENYYKTDNSRLIRLLLPLDLTHVPHFHTLYPNIQTLNFAREGAKVYGIGLLGGSYALAYNVDKVPAPDSWTVLLAPAARGKTSITNEQYEANVYQAALMSGVAPKDVYNIDLFTEAQRTLTEEILTKMVVNSASFWGGMPYPKDMAKLNYVTDYWFGVAAANKDGQHWRIASPKEKVTVWLDSLAVAADLAEDEQKVEAAYLLLDFMLSAETQAGIYQKFGSVIVSPDGKKRLPRDLQSQLPGGDFFDETYFWQPLSLRTRNAFKAMWDEAMKARTP
jgi:spermidine/putrescine transport system substrate-binding protein